MLLGMQMFRFRDRHPRRRSPLLPLLALLLTLSVWGALPPAGRAAEGGAIEGQIVLKNGSGGVAGTRVLLQMATPTSSRPEERAATVGEDGRFRFEGLPLGPDYVYLLRVNYEGGSYFQEVAFEDGATSVRAAPIEVYPATREAGAIAIPRLRMIVSPAGPDALQVIENGAFRNATDRAYIGPPNAPDATTLRFGLPRGAGNLQLAQGLNRNTLVALDDAELHGFATLEAIPPGERQFAYLYRLPTADQRVALDRVFPYQTESFQIYLPAGARLEGAGATFQDGGETTLQNGQRFHLYTAQNLAPGTRVQARIVDLPAVDEGRNPLIVPLLIFTLVIGLGLIAVYGRQRRAAPAGGRAPRAGRGIRTVPAGASAARAAAAQPVPPLSANGTRAAGAANGVRAAARNGRATAADLEERRRLLLLELVDLDERHEAGALAEPEYARQRAARKDELVTVLRELEAGSRQPA